jgi:glycine oxidase
VPRSQSRVAHVVVIGGGLMGCSTALALAQKGHRVTVLERSVPGAEASSAAGGIIGAQVEADSAGAMTELCMASRERYPAWVRGLAKATGIDVAFRRSGILEVAPDTSAASKIRARSSWQRRAGYSVETISASRARELEPELAKGYRGVHFPSDGRVDPKLLMRAVHIAAQRAGVTFRNGAYVKQVLMNGTGVRGVALEGAGELAADWVVVAAGSWTPLVGGLPQGAGDVRPARGQIVELESASPPVHRVVFGPLCYLSPRDDGRTLIGSTLEFVGYKRGVTARAVRDLLTAAIEMVPALADAELRSTWSNFRPYTDDHLPRLGVSASSGSSGAKRLIFATGHYRTGILLAPVTADIVTALVSGKRPPVALGAFRPDR